MYQPTSCPSTSEPTHGEQLFDGLPDVDRVLFGQQQVALAARRVAVDAHDRLVGVQDARGAQQERAVAAHREDDVRLLDQLGAVLEPGDGARTRSTHAPAVRPAARAPSANRGRTAVTASDPRGRGDSHELQPCG